MSEHTVKAVVTLTVEVDVSHCWGGDCAMSQVAKQATESARALLEHQPLNPSLAARRVEEILRRTRIVGVPLVKAVVVEERKR